MTNTLKQTINWMVGVIEFLPVRFNLQKPTDTRCQERVMRNPALEELELLQHSQIRLGPL
ncbi:hypothetical protein E1162_13430 [Rhodobacteraceae bacterium RKSG542]|uniref:hypothetical protein n=1 Tax=Pseudovibrio flavus TaxID=2529854 RepID=UPI0012BD2B35|nr:hypothetical protein [Pseudovibrio flavus]MTI18242.1 hypothetical protein [Pseudovibrio flavus]